MEVLKECRENNPEELYGVAVAIRPEVMNGEMADFLLPLDGRCISILPVHLQTPERVRVAVETSGMSAVGRGGVPKSLLTPDVYVRCAAHSRESLMMIPWAERSPEVCLMAKTLYPDIVKNHPEFVPESVHNQDSIYTLNSLMESLTGEKFSYRQMTDFYNGKPLNVKRMETPGGVQKDKSVKFDKETGGFSFSDIHHSGCFPYPPCRLPVSFASCSFPAPLTKEKKCETDSEQKKGRLKHPLVHVAKVGVLGQYDVV